MTVENNVFFDCDKGIALGNPSGHADRKIHIKDSVVRNNVILGGSNKAIEVDFGENVLITGNKIASDIRVKYPVFRVLNILNSSVISNNEIAKGSFDVYEKDPNVVVEGDKII